jgi:PiT family inorganic phosphate transporter
MIAGGIAIIVGIVGKIAISRVHIDPQADKEMHFTNVEKIFGILMITTACCMAFAHGSNDVANAIGPLAAVVSVIQSGGELVGKAKLDWWILPLGAVGIVIGLATLGAKVIKTIGTAITHLTPSRGFAAEMSAATTVVIASGTGLPISTTQTLVGAVLGVGLARGIAALNLSVVRNIFISWVVTLPVGAGLSILFFYIIKAIFSA